MSGITFDASHISCHCRAIRAVLDSKSTGPAARLVYAKWLFIGTFATSISMIHFIRTACLILEKTGGQTSNGAIAETRGARRILVL